MNSSDNENEIVNLSTVHRVDAVGLTYLAHCAKLINDQASPRVQSTTFFSCSNVRKINIVVGFKRVHLKNTVSYYTYVDMVAMNRVDEMKRTQGPIP